MTNEARVVQLQSSIGPLSIELYHNTCADSFWQLANSGQLGALVFRHLLGGFALLGEVEDVCARHTTAADLEACVCGPSLRHVGAGLLSCQPQLGTVAGSDFLIMLSPQPKLDATHVVFGRVYSGLPTLEKAAVMQVDANFQLYTPVTVLRCSTALLSKTAPPAVEGRGEGRVAHLPQTARSRPILASLES